jgi:hypothetical protein
MHSQKFDLTGYCRLNIVDNHNLSRFDPIAGWHTGSKP